MGLLGTYLGQNGTVIYSAQNGIFGEICDFEFRRFPKKFSHTPADKIT